MPVTIVCKICGSEKKVSPSQQDRKYCSRGCYAADMNRVSTTRNGTTRRKTHDQFLTEVDRFLNSEYTVLGEYKNNRTKVEALHVKCGNVVQLNPKDVLKGIGCFSCGKKKAGLTRRKSNEVFNEEFSELFGEEYRLLSEYVTSRDKVKIIHTECGTEFYATPNNLISKLSKCPTCNQSKGEEFISLLLQELSVPHKREAKLPGCYFKADLRFDFLVEVMGDVALLIEYDGIQHYQPIDVFGGEDGFRLTVERDKIKDEYCAENNIFLLRIPYTHSEADIKEEVINALIRCNILSDMQIPSQSESEMVGSV